LNAAAALYAGGASDTFEDGVAMAQEAIRSGAGLVALDRLRTAFNRPVP
jgi:anthranilate phosphoribosyltransferase